MVLGQLVRLCLRQLDFSAAVVDDILYVIGWYTHISVYPYAKTNSLVEAYVPFGYQSVPVVGMVSPLSEAVCNQSSVEWCLLWISRLVSCIIMLMAGGCGC